MGTTCAGRKDDDDTLPRDCAATAEAAAALGDARLRRAAQGLWTARRFMLRAIMATSLGRDAVRAECNRGLERIDEALREIGETPC